VIEASLKKRLKGFELELSLKVKRAEYIVLLGRSGAGKSLTAKLLAGIERPDEGRIYLEGKDITNLPPERRGISYLPQSSCLFPHMSVMENLEFPFKVRGEKPDKNKIEELAERFGIAHLLTRRGSEVSGGEAQRAALARALLSSPKAVILDEPLNSLDFLTKVEMVDFLKGLKGKLTFIHITHDPFEAKALADRVLYLEGGRLAFSGGWSEFLKSPGELPKKLNSLFSP